MSPVPSLPYCKSIALFEAFLAATRYQPLRLKEICAAIGVPERTLRDHCYKYLGTGPTHYLWLKRMDLVNRALLSADAKGMTVTKIAIAHGFYELGRFSVDYRVLFRESPSETLRRSQLLSGDAERPLARRSGDWTGAGDRAAASATA